MYCFRYLTFHCLRYLSMCCLRYLKIFSFSYLTMFSGIWQYIVSLQGGPAKEEVPFKERQDIQRIQNNCWIKGNPVELISTIAATKRQ